jgi:monovalent cation:H+ antiporter-2, CPA2 family
LVQEVKPLYELGAAEVIPEEFETSIEIFTRVLIKYLIPRQQIEKFIAEVRADGYEMLRSVARPASGFHDLKMELSDLEVSTLFVEEESPLAGKTLAKLQLRKRYGVSVLAIRRDSELVVNPDGDARIQNKDRLIVIGRPENIADVFDQEDFSAVPI